jgi:hypothetical protein
MMKLIESPETVPVVLCSFGKNVATLAVEFLLFDRRRELASFGLQVKLY